MNRVIASFDTDRIKEYVFSTGVLKEIRGGSALLDELNRKEMEKRVLSIDPTAECIFANGGSGMFELDESKADECIKAIEKLYQTETITGSITGTYIPIKGDADFKEVFAELNYNLRIAKKSKQGRIQLVTHQFIRTCDSCGVEYACCKGQEKLLCHSCNLKQEKAKQVKDRRDKTVLEGASKIRETYLVWDWLFKELSNNPKYLKELPEDFNKLGELSSPSNYMGLLYADGNGMGAKLKELDSWQELKIFSETVDNGIRNAVLQAIQSHLQPQNAYLPFDILLAGGDDLVMVTAADRIVRTAITIIETFEKYTKEQLGEALTISVGIAIAHAKFPFNSLLSLAEDLLKFAKKESAKREQKSSGKKTSQSLINFQVVSSSNSLHFSKDYKRIFETKGELGRPTLVRTLRPYDLEKIDKLLDAIKKIKQIPKNKLQAIQESLFMDYGNSLLQGLYLFSRLKKEQKSLLLTILQDFSNDNTGLKPFPWLKKNDICFTPFLDIMELYDFVQ